MEQFNTITDRLKDSDDERLQKAGNVLEAGFATSLGIHQLVKEGNILGKITDMVKAKSPQVEKLSASGAKKNIAARNADEPLQNNDVIEQPTRFRSANVDNTLGDGEEFGINMGLKRVRPTEFVPRTQGTQSAVNDAEAIGEETKDAESVLGSLTDESTALDETPVGLVLTGVLGLASLGTSIAELFEPKKPVVIDQTGGQIY